MIHAVGKVTQNLTTFWSSTVLHIFSINLLSYCIKNSFYFVLLLVFFLLASWVKLLQHIPLGGWSSFKLILDVVYHSRKYITGSRYISHFHIFLFYILEHWHTWRFNTICFIVYIFQIAVLSVVAVLSSFLYVFYFI